MSVAVQELMVRMGLPQSDARAAVLEGLKSGILQSVGARVFRRTQEGIEETKNEVLAWSMWEEMLVDWDLNQITRNESLPDRLAGRRTTTGPVVKAEGIKIWDGWARFIDFKEESRRLNAVLDDAIKRQVDAKIHASREAKGKRGRKAGWGYASSDEAHLVRMGELLRCGASSVSAAAEQVLDEADGGQGPAVTGGGDRRSKVTRLRKRYIDRFGRSGGE